MIHLTNIYYAEGTRELIINITEKNDLQIPWLNDNAEI